MKSPSIDKLHIVLNKHILLAQSYTEFKKLEFIIKACRLKPYQFIFNDKDKKIILFRKWFDVFGKSIEISSKKKIKLIYNDLSLDRGKIICTDIYYGLPIDKILQLSKLLYVFHGKDEDTYEDCMIVSFLGIDNYLRSYMYTYGEWQIVSSLFLGINNLSIIGSNLDIKYFREFSNKKNEPIPCISSRQWLSYLPVSQDFQDLLEKQCNIVCSFLQRNNNKYG